MPVAFHLSLSAIHACQWYSRPLQYTTPQIGSLGSGICRHCGQVETTAVFPRFKLDARSRCGVIPPQQVRTYMDAKSIGYGNNYRVRFENWVFRKCCLVLSVHLSVFCLWTLKLTLCVDLSCECSPLRDRSIYPRKTAHSGLFPTSCITNIDEKHD